MAGVVRDEEVIFAKNNVNVVIRTEPSNACVKVDGYLTIKKRTGRAGRRGAASGLIAHWIPNEQLASRLSGDGGYTFTVDLGQMRCEMWDVSIIYNITRRGLF